MANPVPMEELLLQGSVQDLIDSGFWFEDLEMMLINWRELGRSVKGLDAKFGMLTEARERYTLERQLPAGLKKAAHYEPGRRSDYAFVLACPGRHEEKAVRPASGVTGHNLSFLVGSLFVLSAGKIAPGRRGRFDYGDSDYTVTNSVSEVFYPGKNDHSLPEAALVQESRNLARLLGEIRSTRRAIICLGNEARAAVSRLSGLTASLAHECHPGATAINTRIAQDINGDPIRSKSEVGEQHQTQRRIAVMAASLLRQLSR